MALTVVLKHHLICQDIHDTTFCLIQKKTIQNEYTVSCVGSQLLRQTTSNERRILFLVSYPYHRTYRLNDGTVRAKPKLQISTYIILPAPKCHEVSQTEDLVLICNLRKQPKDSLLPLHLRKDLIFYRLNTEI